MNNIIKNKFPVKAGALWFGIWKKRYCKKKSANQQY